MIFQRRGRLPPGNSGRLLCFVFISELTCLMGSIVQESRGWSHMSARSGHEGVAMKTIRVIALLFGGRRLLSVQCAVETKKEQLLDEGEGLLG